VGEWVEEHPHRCNGNGAGGGMGLGIFGRQTGKGYHLKCKLKKKKKINKNGYPPKEFNVLLINTPKQFFTVLERKILNFLWENKTKKLTKLRISKIVLYNKRTSRNISISLALLQSYDIGLKIYIRYTS
jgi:hypothetical protein